MNLALSALLILLLLLPAYSFRLGIVLYSVYRNRRPRNNNDLRFQALGRNLGQAFDKVNFTETVFVFSVVPIALHLVSLYIIHRWTTLPFDLLLNIFSGKNDAISSSADRLFGQQLNWFLVYILFEVLLGGILGIAASFFGRNWLLQTLVGDNIWYRLFTGSRLSKEEKSKLYAVLVEVLMSTKETTVIYSGLLQAFDIMPGGDALSYITLNTASRRDLRASQQTIIKQGEGGSESTANFHDDYGVMINIPGHSFTIQGKDILNVNVTYMESGIDPDSGKPVLRPMVIQ